MKRESIKKLTYGGLMTALVFIATGIIPSIPVPGTTGGYIHIGDSMIYVASILLGWKYGAIAGGLGSALADIAKGYAYWALPTLIIKSIMGIIAGLLPYKLNKKSENNKPIHFSSIIGITISGIWMIIGYYIAECIMVGNFIAPIASIPYSLLQFIGGIIIAIIVLIPMKNIQF